MTDEAAPTDRTSTEDALRRPPPGRVAAAVPLLLGWLVPGAGHWRLGYGWAAVFVAGGVLPLFVLGMAMAGWENVSVDRHPYYFAVHAFAGLPTLIAEFATRDVILDHRPPHQSVGMLYTAVAGLLNLVAVADVWARCVRGAPEYVAGAARGDGSPAADGDPDLDEAPGARREPSAAPSPEQAA